MDRVHFGKTDDTQLGREFQQEFVQVFREHTGLTFKAKRFNLLTKEEQDKIINEAGRRVQEKRKEKLIG